MEQAGIISRSEGSRPGIISTWIQASRVWTLTVSSVAVLVGTAAAVYAGSFSASRFVLALIGAVLIQAATNMVNDYYDFRSGADPSDPAVPESFGPSLAIQRGLLTPDQVWYGAIVAFAIGSAIGLVLTYLCGWPVLVIGVLSVAAGYFYTAEPISLAYYALGDITSFIFLGPAIVLGAYYVMALNFTWGVAAASISIGALGSGILQANNLRDVESDHIHGKRTLATILGRRGALWQLIAFDAGAFAATAIGAVLGAMPWLTLAVFVSAPRAFTEIRILKRETDARKLNVALQRSAQLHMEFGLLLVAAYLVSALLGW
jgi:1,4-dihydroxy-2-naphthoate polyprenyltransferase